MKKKCPECKNGILEWNSYFHRYLCNKCRYEEIPKPEFVKGEFEIDATGDEIEVRIKCNKNSIRTILKNLLQ